MAVEVIIIPEIVNLTGPNAIVQGSDCFFEFQVKDDEGGVVDLTSGVVKCQLRTAGLNAGGVTTGCPQPNAYISDAINGKIFLHFPNAQTKYVSGQVMKGIYDIELLHINGLKYRTHQGSWTIDNLQVTNSLNA